MQVCRAFISGYSKFLHLCNKCTTLAHSRCHGESGIPELLYPRTKFSAIYTKKLRTCFARPLIFKGPSYSPVAKPQLSVFF